MHESPTGRNWFRARVPRYSLRALLVCVAVTAVMVQLGKIGWRRALVYREARQYSTLQAAKKWPISSLESFVIDDGRGVPDDFVILVRQANTFGCFIPRNQCKKGESVEYDWYYRTDGVGRFDARDPQVQSGHGFAGPYITGSGTSVTIKFGPFTIPWSGNERGWGYIYYDYNPDPPDGSAPDVLRICSTDTKSVNLISARDDRWIYKSCRKDPGLAGDVDVKMPAGARNGE